MKLNKLLNLFKPTLIVQGKSINELTLLARVMSQITRKTVIGQNLDLVTAPTDRIDFSAYTIARYNAIVEYKTAYYSFYLPVACALHMVWRFSFHVLISQLQM